ncbi:MFS general substrate transporter [Gymnopus androsaceus JB14]|uniref:MFS general substrate transporter n=1 Tax=Gymnopus androsaceus JB14 TaxID=1447944 RepID=A0A6A4HSD9_9AGAR|nr:MFS general substrate transporter [Gymnopus androsaceus JB14]
MAARTSLESSPSPTIGTIQASERTVEGSPTGISKPVKSKDVEKNEGDEVKVDPSAYAPTDGGWDAWSTVFGGTLVALGTFGFVNAFGAFSDYYNEEYLTNYSPTIISMVGALQVFVLYLFAGTAGAIFDAIGPRYLIPGSGIVVVFSLFMLSITRPQQIYQQFLSQSVLFSLGATLSFFPSMGLAAHWFRSKIPYAIRMCSFRSKCWTIRIFAFLTLFCFAVGTVTIKQRRPSKPFPTSLSTFFDFAAFKDPCYLFLVLGCWFTVFAVFNPFFYVGLSAAVASPDANVNGYYLAILCATSIFGRLWYTSFAQANLIAFAALYGVFSGPFFSVTPSCVAEISPIERVGARIGGTYAFMASATLAGTPISGIFIQNQTEENFDKLILFSGIMSLVRDSFALSSHALSGRRISLQWHNIEPLTLGKSYHNEQL